MSVFSDNFVKIFPLDISAAADPTNQNLASVRSALQMHSTRKETSDF